MLSNKLLFELINLCKLNGINVALFIANENKDKFIELELRLKNAKIKPFFITTDVKRIDTIVDTVVILSNNITPLPFIAGTTVIDATGNHLQYSQSNKDFYYWNGTAIVPADTALLPEHNPRLTNDSKQFFEFFKENTVYSEVPVLRKYDKESYFLITVLRRIDQERFEDVVKEIEQAIKQGYKRIVFDCSIEHLTYNELFKFQRIANYFSNVKVPFFYWTASLEAEKYYNKFCNAFGVMKKMIMVPFDHTQSDVKHSIKSFSDVQYEIKEKNKIFLCFNRIPRWHRIELFSFMKTSGLIEKGFYSFDLSKEIWNRYLTYEYSINHTVIENIEHSLSSFPLILNRTADRDNPTELRTDDLIYTQDSYFSIVTETVFFHEKTLWPGKDSSIDGVRFGEKVYKPMAYKHPFILLGFTGSLNILKQLGFKTFHPFIDETYDTIEDDYQRLSLIFNEINRLCSFTTNEWIEWQQNVKPIIDHNFNALYNNTVKGTTYIDK